jgi:hypothetical protein
MPATNLRVAYRPVRVGFLLRAGSLDDVQSAARLASTLWGGVYHPLIAVEDLEQAQRLVTRFRPDVLYPVAADETLDAVVAAHPHIAWPVALEYFDGLAPHEGELPFVDVRPAIGAIYSELRLQRTSPWLRPTWEESDLAPLFAVLFGEYGDDDEYLEWFLGALRAGQRDARQLPPGVDWTRTPLGATAYALEPPFAPGGLTSDGVVICDPRDPNDLALFWNLRASGAGVAFWPRDDVPPLQASAADHVSRLVAEPRRRLDLDVELWSTTEWPRGPVLPDALAEALGDSERVLAHLDWDTFRQPLNLPQPVATDEVGVLAAVEGDSYDNVRLSLALPPTPFQGAGLNLFQERLLVRLSPLVDQDETHTLRLPYLPDLNDWYDRELTLTRDGVRVEVEAVAVFARPRDSSLSLRLARRADVIRQVFARAGIEATPSAAGRAVDIVGAQLGGLRGARVLRAPGVRELLRTPKWRNWKIAFGAIARGGLPDQRHQTPADVLETLLARGALVAGLKLQCPSCRVRERYTLDQLGEEMRCPRCRNIFAPTSLLHDSIWEYAASGFFADEGAHGAVPVLLTMIRLAQDTSGERFIISSHDLRGDGIDCESDLLVLEQHHDGRLAVAVSECKDAGEIDQSDLDNLATVAERLYASGVECYLIFTTLRDEFTPAEFDRFRAYRDQLADQWSHDTSELEGWRRPAPVLFTPRELGQWQLYPAADREGLPHQQLLGLRELAANSAARYLD